MTEGSILPSQPAVSKKSTRLLPVTTLSEPALTAIGDVVAEFGRIEYDTKLAIKNMVGDFTKGLIEAEKLHRFSAIADHAIAKAEKQFGAKKAKRLIGLIKAAKKLTPFRNDVVHGCWFADDRLVRMEFKKPHSLKHHNYIVRLDELQALADRLRATRLEIH